MTALRRRIKAARPAGRSGVTAWCRRQARFLLAWGAITVVAFNSAALLVIPVSPQLLAASADGRGRMVVCTAAGLISVHVNADGQPSDEPTNAGVCANCLPLLAATVSAPAANVLAVLAPTPLAPFREELVRHVASVHRPTARAPPVA